MKNYIGKFYELECKGNSVEEITENIYLNYPSLYENDQVYVIRKKLSQIYNCNLNDIKLIGSAHIGFTFDMKEKELVERDEPSDYDFAIIDTSLFSYYFDRVNFEVLRNKKRFQCNLNEGIIHPFYADESFLEDLNKKHEEIKKEANLDKKISVCFYISEKSFIKKLTSFMNSIYIEVLKLYRDSVGQEEKLSKELVALNKLES